MAKPLRSENPQPQDIQFKHFGVLNAGQQSKTSLFTSITVNVLLAIIIVIIGAAAKKVVEDKRVKEAIYVAPVKEVPPEPKPPPKMPPPPKLPPPKPLPDPPKIKIPDPPKLPDPPKPVEVKMTPKPPTPVVTMAQPKMIVAAAAPKVVAVNMPAASASVKNNDAHPSAVALGRQDNPIAVSKSASATAINLGNKGLPGMNASNTGGGPPSQKVSLGNGSAGGSLAGTGVRAVEGVKIGGVTNGTGKGPGNGNYNTPPQQVQIGQVRVPPPVAPPAAKASTKTPPTVTYKPAPVYTAEARADHIEGAVRVHIHVTATGQVQVMGVVSGLGHGLDQSAMQVCQNMKFKPAVDANGNPVDWDGNVTVTFQLA